MRDFNPLFKKYYETRVFSPQKGQFAVVFTDITERKQAELEGVRQSEELARLYRALRILADRFDT